MSEFAIRPFESADAPQVVNIWRQCLPSSHPWNEPTSVICSKRNRADGLFFVGEMEGRLVATVMAGYDGVRGWIYSLAVKEACRSRGFGRQMLAFAEDALMARGCRKIGLQVRDTNTSVIGFYQRCGYNAEERASMAKVLPVVEVFDPVPTISVDDKIVLSQINRDDKPALLHALNETKSFSQFMVRMPFPYLEHDADEWIAKANRGSMLVDNDRNWAVRMADTGSLIGGIGLFNMTSQCAEIGYWIARPHWRKGIATRVVNAICLHAYDELKLPRVWAKVLSGNPGSMSVLTKSGFQPEGVLRSHFARNGQTWDVHQFGRLRSDPSPAGFRC